MTEICFDVLGIAPTKDETTIKKAYRKLLHSVNPEARNRRRTER